MKKINLSFKNQKQNSLKIFKTFRLNQTPMKINKNYSFMNSKNHSLINDSIYICFHNEEIKNKIISNALLLSNSNKKINKKNTFNQLSSDNKEKEKDKSFKKDYSMLLISQNLKNKIFTVSNKKSMNNSPNKDNSYNSFRLKHKSEKNCLVNLKRNQSVKKLKIENLKEKIPDKKILKLFNNKESIFPLLIETMKNIKEESKNYKGKIILYDKIKQFNKLKKIQTPILKQLFLLNKEINLNEEDKLSQKQISSNTFMDMKVKIF